MTGQGNYGGPAGVPNGYGTTQAPAVHRPKVEYFDIAELTNTDPKGFVRQVERYHVEPWGLYMARTADHPEFHYLESWFLPTLSLRATVFHYTPAHRRDQDYYIDIGDFGEVAPGRWRSIDHYLDLTVRTGRDIELLDVDELLTAHAACYLTLSQAQRAIEVATTAIAGIAAHGYNFERWVEKTQGVTLTWL
jgi:predicted RNA-binding protein associated with RNAse of E/G family